MVVAVVALAALLLSVVIASWLRHRPARSTSPSGHLDRNVVSLDVYRLARLSGRATAASAHDPSARPRFEYPLSATSGGGLRTVRQPDGSFVRPTARPELA